jgi:dienelactone hydrolase
MDLAAHAARLEPHMTIVKPAGPGPFPVSLQFHGCGGIYAMQYEYAEAARAAGVAVVVVDSFGPRGIGAAEARATVCTGVRFRGAERSIDVLAVLAWLKTQAWVDPDRIAAAGWSHGGWALMEALAGTLPEARAAPLPFKAVSLFYPYCGPLSRTWANGWGENRPAIFACVGGRDVVVGRLLPERTLRRLEGDGLPLRLILLKEAAHAFDEQSPVAPRTRFRPDLAEIARAFYVEALRESLMNATPKQARISA